LSQPAERSGGYRDELFFKLLVASRQSAAQVAGVVSRQRAYQLGQLRSLADLRGTHAGEPLVQLLIDAARLHNEADLRLLDLAHAARNRLATSAEADRRTAKPGDENLGDDKDERRRVRTTARTKGRQARR
jgi:hypothetical protein